MSSNSLRPQRQRTPQHMTLADGSKLVSIDNVGIEAFGTAATTFARQHGPYQLYVVDKTFTRGIPHGFVKQLCKPLYDLATNDNALLAEWAELAMKAFTDTPYEDLMQDLEKMIVAAVGRSTAVESADTGPDESKEGAARAGEGVIARDETGRFARSAGGTTTVAAVPEMTAVTALLKMAEVAHGWHIGLGSLPSVHSAISRWNRSIATETYHFKEKFRSELLRVCAGTSALAGFTHINPATNALWGAAELFRHIMGMWSHPGRALKELKLFGKFEDLALGASLETYIQKLGTAVRRYNAATNVFSKIGDSEYLRKLLHQLTKDKSGPITRRGGVEVQLSRFHGIFLLDGCSIAELHEATLAEALDRLRSAARELGEADIEPTAAASVAAGGTAALFGGVPAKQRSDRGPLLECAICKKTGHGVRHCPDECPVCLLDGKKLPGKDCDAHCRSFAQFRRSTAAATKAAPRGTSRNTARGSTANGRRGNGGSRTGKDRSAPRALSSSTTAVATAAPTAAAAASAATPAATQLSWGTGSAALCCSSAEAAQLLFQDTESETDARPRSDSDASLTAIAMAVSDIDVQLEAHGAAIDQELDDEELAQALAELDWGHLELSEKELTAITTPTRGINYNHPGGASLALAAARCADQETKAGDAAGNAVVTATCRPFSPPPGPPPTPPPSPRGAAASSGGEKRRRTPTRAVGHVTRREHRAAGTEDRTAEYARTNAIKRQRRRERNRQQQMEQRANARVQDPRQRPQVSAGWAGAGLVVCVELAGLTQAAGWAERGAILGVLVGGVWLALMSGSPCPHAHPSSRGSLDNASTCREAGDTDGTETSNPDSSGACTRRSPAAGTCARSPRRVTEHAPAVCPATAHPAKGAGGPSPNNQVLVLNPRGWQGAFGGLGC